VFYIEPIQEEEEMAEERGAEVADGRSKWS